MKRRKGAEGEAEAKAKGGCKGKGKGKGKGGTDTDMHRCRRSDGRGWRCPFTAMVDSSFCEKHFQQRLRYMVQATLNGRRKPQLKRPRVENIAYPCRNKRSPSVKVVAEQDTQRTQPLSATGKRKIGEEKDCSSRSPPVKVVAQQNTQRTQPQAATWKRKISEDKDCSSRSPPVKVVTKQDTQRTQPQSATRKRKISEDKDCSSRSPSVKVVAEQDTQRTQPQAATGKRKISEDKDCSSRSTTTEKETNLSTGFDVEDVASHSIRQTNGKFKEQEIGRYLRKYLASGVMEIALDYDSDYDFRKVAGLELSQ